MLKPVFYWAGKPVYQCQVCGRRFQRVNNAAAVLEHERDAHSVSRVSPILGPNGETVVVTEDKDL